nr:unnamed protein product [Digitaria exilis]
MGTARPFISPALQRSTSGEARVDWTRVGRQPNPFGPDPVQKLPLPREERIMSVRTDVIAYCSDPVRHASGHFLPVWRTWHRLDDPTRPVGLTVTGPGSQPSARVEAPWRPSAS